jgi:plasmid stabilization system protein ParE
VQECTEVWKKKAYLVSIARYNRTLRAVFDELLQVRGIGSFIAYEIVSDLRHTRLLREARDINTWANVGPGAMRGLRRLDASMTNARALPAMIELLGESRQYTAEWVPQMELRDIEHVLCEFDKFCRVKFGEGRPRSTYKGKAE